MASRWFAQIADEPVPRAFGHDEKAGGWLADKHPRFLADTTGDGNPDIVGFGNEGVWVSHSRGCGQFEQAQLVCRGFGYNEDAGGWRVDRHPRFLADITGDGRVDIVGFGGPGGVRGPKPLPPLQDPITLGGPPQPHHGDSPSRPPGTCHPDPTCGLAHLRLQGRTSSNRSNGLLRRQ